MGGGGGPGDWGPARVVDDHGCGALRRPPLPLPLGSAGLHEPIGMAWADAAALLCTCRPHRRSLNWAAPSGVPARSSPTARGCPGGLLPSPGIVKAGIASANHENRMQGSRAMNGAGRPGCPPPAAAAAARRPWRALPCSRLSSAAAAAGEAPAGDSEDASTPLLDAVLERGGRSSEAPFHVPGHKRGAGAPPGLRALMGGALAYDLTELSGGWPGVCFSHRALLQRRLHDQLCHADA